MSGRQHGVVSHAQLRSIGFSQDAIDHRVARRRLIRLWPRVFAVGDLALPANGRTLAAVLTSGPEAVVSGHTAASTLGLLQWRDPIEIIAPRRRRPKPGIEVRVEALPADERTVVGGIPTTTPTRTIFDLARVLDVASLRSLLDDARRMRLPLEPSLNELLDRNRARPGAKAIRLLLAEIEAHRGVTRSVFEAAFLPFLASIGLPSPIVNHPIDCAGEVFLLDLAWPGRGLAIELDGHAYHSTRAQLERDKRRDRKLSANGYRVLRITWRQFEAERGELAQDLREAFALAPDGSGGARRT